MEKKDLDIETIKRYWVAEAEEGLNVAGHLFEKGDYSYALFFGHLAIEKLLKGLYVERKHKHPPRIHNLLRLARLAGIELDEAQKDGLVVISSFNIEARYPDLKRSFRDRCNEEFAQEQMKNVKEMFEWLNRMIR